MVHEMVVLPHDQPIIKAAGVDPRVVQRLLDRKWTGGGGNQKNSAQGDPHHQGWSKPTVETMKGRKSCLTPPARCTNKPWPAHSRSFPGVALCV